MVAFLWRKLNIFLSQTVLSKLASWLSESFLLFRKPHMTLKISVADPDLGSGVFWTPRSKMGKKSGIGIRDENPNHILSAYNHLGGLKYLNSLRLIKKTRIRDPGSRINILDPHHC